MYDIVKMAISESSMTSILKVFMDKSRYSWVFIFDSLHRHFCIIETWGGQYAKSKKPHEINYKEFVLA